MRLSWKCRVTTKREAPMSTRPDPLRALCISQDAYNEARVEQKLRKMYEPEGRARR
jgi:hypothetical protein